MDKGLFDERQARAKKIVRVLKRLYPEVKSELHYTTPFQFLVAVVLSAQCTDKRVNMVTATLFKKYHTAKDFAEADPAVFAKEIGSIPFFNNKTKAIIGSGGIVVKKFGGNLPKTEKELVQLPAADNCFCFVVKKRNAPNLFCENGWVGLCKILCGVIFFKKCCSHHIYPLIGTLRRKHHCNEKLERCCIVQFGAVYR